MHQEITPKSGSCLQIQKPLLGLKIGTLFLPVVIQKSIHISNLMFLCQYERWSGGSVGSALVNGRESELSQRMVMGHHVPNTTITPLVNEQTFQLLTEVWWSNICVMRTRPCMCANLHQEHPSASNINYMYTVRHPKPHHVMYCNRL